MKARAQKSETSTRASNTYQKAPRSLSTSSRAATSSSASPHHLASSSFTSSAAAPSPKLNSLAATHKLKKDIHRCHRMSRRPLPRADPMAATFSTPGGFPSRLHVSPFSETVRILNRRVKPREVKRSRIILNLKVIDKPGRGGPAASSRNITAGRQNIPSRNRIIGKKGEAPYRPFQPPLKMLGFPMYGKPFGLQCGGPMTFHSCPGSYSNTGARNTLLTPSQYQSPPSPSSSSGSEGKSPTTAIAAPQSHQTTGASVLGPVSSRGSHLLASSQAKPSKPQMETTKGQGAKQSARSPSSYTNPGASSFPLSPSGSASSSMEDEEEEGVLDSLMPREEGRKTLRSCRFKRQRSAALSSVPSGDHSSTPAEPRRVPAEGDPDWHPEMAPSCKDVVVTDVTTNLVTVTIKEFPSPSSCPASPSTVPESVAAAALPSDVTSDDPSPPKP
ncbi:chromobox protein homolog 6a isoform X1 [Thalassophryne amazonica]|uniref:chromobox protein homolog 6a isoform X1 n=1 Tax=Thalassophryne amazonica TaxID=390379 RepID=UPI001470EAB0|nr:chromobox protein homolog 6a isoform X1 [Thalassophryne amazonica]